MKNALLILLFIISALSIAYGIMQKPDVEEARRIALENKILVEENKILAVKHKNEVEMLARQTEATLQVLHLQMKNAEEALLNCRKKN